MLLEVKRLLSMSNEMFVDSDSSLLSSLLQISSLVLFTSLVWF